MEISLGTEFVFDIFNGMPLGQG